MSNTMGIECNDVLKTIRTRFGPGPVTRLIIMETLRTFLE